MIRFVKRLILTIGAMLIGLALVAGLEHWLGQFDVQAKPLLVEFSVTNTNDSGSGSLRMAIADANNTPGSDLITITANGTLLLLSPLPVITDSVTIQGPGAGQFIVDGNASSRVLDIALVDVTLADLTLQNGNVTGASEDGAGIRSTGDLNLERVEVLSNTAEGDGAGLFISGMVTITDGLIQNNHSTSGIGGGIRVQGNTVISGTQISNNSSQGDGGGAYILGGLTLVNATFSGNECTAGSCDGGGLFSFSQTDIQDSQFIGNTAQDQGGGASAPGNLMIGGTLFQENEAIFGTGGALYAQNQAEIQTSQFISNTARSSGGGVYAFGELELVNVVFQNNESTIGDGGGVYVGGNLILDRSQFLRNTSNEGGGLFHSLENALLVNTLFAENMATGSAGTALRFASNGLVDVVHSTVVGPVMGTGPAIDISDGTVSITNTIVASSTVGINRAGGTVNQDYNLFFGNGTNTQGTISGGANSLSGDPSFVAPAMDDYHITMDSAGLNLGVDAGVTVDFEGDFRPQDGGFDIGFDEADLTLYSFFLPMISYQEPAQ